MPATQLDRHFKINALAAHLGIGRSTIKGALRNRELPFRRLGDGARPMVLIAESDAAAWLEKRTTRIASAEETKDSAAEKV